MNTIRLIDKKGKVFKQYQTRFALSELPSWTQYKNRYFGYCTAIPNGPVYYYELNGPTLDQNHPNLLQTLCSRQPSNLPLVAR